jgi:hypothetical protein
MRVFSLVPVVIAGFFVPAAAGPVELVVNAGDHDRRDSLVVVAARDDLPDHPVLVDAENSVEYPLQPHPGGGQAFVLPSLDAGLQLRLTVKAAENAPPAHVRASAGQFDAVELDSGGRLIARYVGGFAGFPQQGIDRIFERGGYIHPLATPGGRVVTGDYPADHRHHHGVWTAWTRVRIDGREPDFWNMGQGKGRVEFVALDRHWSGPAHAGFAVRHRAVDLTGGGESAVMDERWTVVSRATEKANMVDLHVEQKTRDGITMELPEHRYGGIGFRGANRWMGPASPKFLASDGETSRLAINGKPVRWLYIGDQFDGGAAGFVVLCHPGNFRAPQPVRVHPLIPFVSFAPQMAGDMRIGPGDTHVMRYQIVAFDGEPDPDVIEQWWNDYAHPVAGEWRD